MSDFFHMILYFSYFIFFSSYIFKILFFLSPLFFTTFLFSLSLFTTLHFQDICSNFDFQTTQNYPTLIFYSFVKLNHVLRSKFEFKDEDFMSFVELQAYKMVFETYLPSENEPFDTNSSTELDVIDKFCSHESIVEESVVEISLLKCENVMNLESETDQKHLKEEEEVKLKSGIVSDKGKGQNGKFGLKLDSIDDVKTMKKEKEWRRTLACKLFEERHNNGNGGLEGEGMDHLWEAYEKKSIEEEEDDDDDGGDDGDVEEQKLCCLQALKFSTGKMRLGISKSKLLKLSKAFRGFGRLYNVTKYHKR